MSTITTTSMVPRKRGVDRDTRSMLLALGVGQYNAAMLASTMFLMPRTTDPSAQAVMFVIQGAQRGLQKMKAPGVVPNGLLDQPTQRALRQTSGLLWANKTWVQIYGDVLDALEGGKKFPGSGGSAVGDYLEVGDTSEYVSAGAAVLGLVLLLYSMKD